MLKTAQCKLIAFLIAVFKVLGLRPHLCAVHDEGVIKGSHALVWSNLIDQWMSERAALRVCAARRQLGTGINRILFRASRHVNLARIRSVCCSPHSCSFLGLPGVLPVRHTAIRVTIVPRTYRTVRSIVFFFFFFFFFFQSPAFSSLNISYYGQAKKICSGLDPIPSWHAVLTPLRRGTSLPTP
jgi:hypothetical protein